MISIIIPTFNESAIIEASLREVLEHLRGSRPPFEILVCDDGSTDGTVDLVQKSFVDEERIHVHPLKHAGKGHAVKAGMLEAAGDFIIFMDADLSTPLDNLDALIEHLRDGTEVVIGSRRHPEKPVENRQSFLRHMAGNVFAFIAHLMATRVKDTQCGFKGFHRPIAQDLAKASRVDGFAFDTELLFLARKWNASIVELPVSWRDDGNSSVNMVTDGFHMLKDLIGVLLRWYAGRYDLPTDNDRTRK